MKRKTNIQLIILLLLTAVFCLLIPAACDMRNDLISSGSTGENSQPTTTTSGGEIPSEEVDSTEPMVSETETELTTGQSQLAILRLGEARDDDSYIFLLDEVVWIDDSSEPNGYRIENDEEEWIPHIASLRTECHVLGPGEESAIELWAVSLDNFVAELEMRGEGMLVEAGIYDGEIYYVSEIYHSASLYN
ncbi:MAG: hypothetical protein GX763_02790 [Clostridiaceae bacterium]|nr:hypothetical protein [Clostridiaceae bacterium]